MISKIYKVLTLQFSMENYQTPNVEYNVFSANMTLDTNAENYSGEDLSICKKCQCNCRLCLGGKAPEGAEIFCKADAENALEQLLAA